MAATDLTQLSDDYRNFPFDDEDNGFQSRLDDIAQRYPEFADHLNPSTWGRRRTPNESSTDNADIFARLRHRPRFTDFDVEFDEPGGTFDRRFDRTADAEQPNEEERVNEKPPIPCATASGRGKKAPIQQSNTVDLGQPQTPLIDERTQRSMSAPPANRNSGNNRRFVSSINIPNFNSDMGTQMPQPEASTTDHGANPKERIIPIHIEGRDEPIVPKVAPQAERLFGQRPGTFTPYVPPPEELTKKTKPAGNKEFQQQQAAPSKQKQAVPNQAPAQQMPANAKPSSLELIQNIQQDVSALMSQVEQFDGKPRDKKYLYLDEMLTRKMILLDDIETGGQDSIRKARKEAIKCIQDTIKILETKAQANEAQTRNKADTMQVEEADLPIEAAAGAKMMVDEVSKQDDISSQPHEAERETKEVAVRMEGTELANADAANCEMDVNEDRNEIGNEKKKVKKKMDDK